MNHFLYSVIYFEKCMGSSLEKKKKKNQTTCVLHFRIVDFNVQVLRDGIFQLVLVCLSEA